LQAGESPIDLIELPSAFKSDTEKARDSKNARRRLDTDANQQAVDSAGSKSPSESIMGFATEEKKKAAMARVDAAKKTKKKSGRGRGSKQIKRDRDLTNL